MKYTPMMQQYLQIKQNYQDAILFFRLGDFYEMFFQDAKTAARELELTLTARDGGDEKVPMCGVPYHSAETYIARLIEKNYKVAICDQVESPEEAKGIVRREVTRIVTPGTILEGEFLDDKSHNYVAAVARYEEIIGLAYADITTGHFRGTQFSGASARELLTDELTRLQPREVVMEEEDILAGENQNFMITFLNPGTCDLSRLNQLTGEQWVKIENCEELEDYPGIMCAAGGLLSYLYETQKQKLVQLDSIEIYSPEEYMVLDSATRKNLEITSSILGNRQGTLFSVLDRTCTAMGARMLRKWLEQPLMNVWEIRRRHDAVETMSGNMFLRESLKNSLDPVYDLERLGGKVAGGSANARDLINLKQSLMMVPELKSVLAGSQSELLEDISRNIDLLDDICSLLDRSIVDEPPVSVREGGIIKQGYSEEVDKLRNSSTNGKTWLAELETEEKKRTGIKSLKIGFNKVFGYYIEVTRANLNLVPEDYIRKQTLVNAERYITPKLKEYEDMILGAEDRLTQVEYELFCRVRDEVVSAVPRLQQTAEYIAVTDALLSFSEVAVRNNYTRPDLNNSRELNIKEGRHPVVENMQSTGEFVPNDTSINREEFLSIITGPNMAGKSTYMRQVALVVLMAQAGSFVPAQEACIGIVDRIFTRVGAADDLAGGRSTFMVEMSECRVIMEYGTAKSLIIMDEVGRGTSTYDGISLARAMVEYIHENIRARTLFSTHYHELTGLEKLPGIKNYTISVKEQGEDIVFIRKLVEGKADRSYGIQVARLAGVPEAILQRAREILEELEENQYYLQQHVFNDKKQECRDNSAYSLYEDNYILEQLKEINISEITPLQALNLIAGWQEELNGPAERNGKIKGNIKK